MDEQQTARRGIGLDLRGLTVQYGKKTALTDISFPIESGRIVGLVGESGSGKSTLAKAIMGRAQVSSGSVVVQGGEALDRTDVQMIYQDPYTSLNPRLRIGTVFRQLLRRRGVTEWRSEAEALLSSVELPANVLDRRPQAFSGGQRQRIAIARALAVRPRMLIADEPTSALDASIRRSVIEILQSLQHDSGLTVLFISHDLSTVAGLCDDVAVMRSGRLVEFGPTTRVLADPKEPYTRDLIASVPTLG